MTTVDIITPETFLASHLTLEQFQKIAVETSASGSTANPIESISPILSLNTVVHNDNPGSSTIRGYKIRPETNSNLSPPSTTLHIENQVSTEASKLILGVNKLDNSSNISESAPLIKQGETDLGLSSRFDVSADVKLIPHTTNGSSKASTIIFNKLDPKIIPGKTYADPLDQILSIGMEDRTTEETTDKNCLNGVKFSNDAEFVIPNDNYRPAPETGEDNRKDYEKIESYNVRISDLFKLAQNISNYDNVLSALCRSTIYQSSNVSDTNDSAWINHYASLNTPQPPLPEPLPDSP